ncbi:MAG: DUF1552 domain-containing protein [Myxococcales bacterium]|nr:DUF1552 domain-containing protein [Myxococcales bacterium]
MRRPHPYSRREALSMAAGALALPFAPLRRAAAAPSGKPPLRLLTIIDSFGLTSSQRASTWISSEVGDYALQDSDLGTVLQPLATYRDQMLVMTGMDMVSRTETGNASNHGALTCHLLTGSRVANAASAARPGAGATQVHPSVDVRVGTFLSNEYGLQFPRVYPHLFFTDYAERTKATYCYDLQGRQIRSVASASSIASTLFEAGDSAAAAQLDVRSRLAMMELIGERVRSVRGDLVNASAPTVMDAYESSVEEVARELELRADLICDPTLELVGETGGRSRNTADILECIYHAFACDLASSITYALGGEQINQMSHGSLYDDTLYDSDVQTYLNRNFHSQSHQTDEAAEKAQELVRIDECRLLAGLLDRLATTPDVDGQSTLLDNTLVYVTSTMGSNVHGTTNIPHLLIAGQNTRLRGGHHYDCSGATNNDLLTTIAQGLTLPDTDFGGYNSDGARLAQLNNGPISRLLRSDA